MNMANRPRKTRMENGAVHFAFITSRRLRDLENELADGIVGELPGWEHSREVRNIRHGAVNVTFFVLRRAHVMMSHGVADKNYLLRRDAAGGLEINKYRTLCVPGPWMKRKLEANKEVCIPAENIRVVGWPRLDKLLAAQLKPPVPADSSRKPKVLWAPTHPGRPLEHTFLSSYPELTRHVEEMRKVLDLEIALHPANRGGGRPTFEQLLEAEYVIADRGTTLYEAWALGKPVVFPRWILRDAPMEQTPGSAEADIYGRQIGLHAHSITDLIDIVMSRPQIGEDVAAFIEDYLPQSTFGQSYKLLAECVRKVWTSGDLTVRPKVLASQQ